MYFQSNVIVLQRQKLNSAVSVENIFQLFSMSTEFVFNKIRVLIGMTFRLG